MSQSGVFAYAQARLHVRQGKRPGSQLWLHMKSAGNLATFLLQAQHTALQPWIAGMQAGQSSHDIELALRERFRAYTHEVAGWLPGGWGAAVDWVGRLPDMAGMHYLLQGGEVLEWMADDPVYQPLLESSAATRRDLLHDAGWGFLFAEPAGSGALHDAWLAQWRRLWPSSRRFAAGLENLGAHLRGYTRQDVNAQPLTGERRQETVEKTLGGVFRRFGFQPAAACAHVALVAADTERLRGELLQRLLFAETPEGRA